ncbi:small membrane A-kinase anchor protein [Elgaria multicarinata webbii]|uniref:small membrane A-kinase anchor protein n=1 Tax=Elgaria multicarinata webbii TaxID=159646 RepID=UPI002FCD69B3
MGCIKSKSPFPHTTLEDGSKEVTGYNSGCNIERSSLLQGKSGTTSSVNAAVLDFAHRLSIDILDQAVKQWAITESKYSDIPFIESDEP